MKGYGLPRNDDVANPDCADIKHYGLKGFKIKSNNKKRARRRFKKAARRVGQRSAGESGSTRRHDNDRTH